MSHAADGEPISLAVIDAVASASGRPPLRGGPEDEGAGTDPLDPLYEAINPDALNAICRSGDDDAQSAKTVTFTYCGYEVTAESTGRITVVER